MHLGGRNIYESRLWLFRLMYKLLEEHTSDLTVNTADKIFEMVNSREYLTIVKIIRELILSREGFCCKCESTEHTSLHAGKKYCFNCNSCDKEIPESSLPSEVVGTPTCSSCKAEIEKDSGWTIYI